MQIISDTFYDSYLTASQNASINSILRGDEMVLIDGVNRSGKSKIVTAVIPEMLQNFVDSDVRSPCIALTSSFSQNLFTIARNFGHYKIFRDLQRTREIRILDLSDLKERKSEGCFISVANMMLRDGNYRLSDEEEDILQRSSDSLRAKLIPSYRSHLEGAPLARGYQMRVCIETFLKLILRLLFHLAPLVQHLTAPHRGASHHTCTEMYHSV